MSAQSLKRSPYRMTMLLLVFAIVGLLVLALALPQASPWFGIATRLVLSLVCFVSAFHNARSGRSISAALLLVVVGLGLLITAMLGYGFNGSPPVPWLFP